MDAGERNTTTEPADLALPARLLVLGTTSGGLLLGGVLVGVLGAAGRLSPHALLVVAAALYTLGCGVGGAGAAVLGLLGCPLGASLRDVRRSILRGVRFALPAVLIAGMAAAWIAAAPIAMHVRSAALMAGVVAALLLALIVFSVAACDTVVCLNNIRMRIAARAKAGRVGCL